MKPLATLPSNTPAQVISIRPDALAPRLVEMGLCTGTQVEVLFRAPFQGPIAIGLGASMLSLRMDEAMLVMVEELGGGE
jgi:Fe2+ transport system protein FeoA